jgi:hypothetical protein
MKSSTNHMGVESFNSGNDNKLKIFRPTSIKFKPKDHIIIDEVQECILDNFWYQYNNKREERGYIISILNNLAEYFHMTNKAMSKYDDHDSIEQKPIYVIFEGSKPDVYISFEEIIGQKVAAKYTGGISWKKYINIDEALAQAQRILEVNYYMEPDAKEYIQKVKMSKNKMVSASPSILDIKKEEVLNKPTYKECLIKGVDLLDGEYIDWKLDEKFNVISPQWKKDIKEEILKEEKLEMNEKIEELKKEYNTKFDISFSNEDIMDIGGHKQKSEE